MTKKEWADIKAAAVLLGLGEKATLAEIKKAYRRLSKKHHPDVQKHHPDVQKHHPDVQKHHPDVQKHHSDVQNNSKQKIEKVEMHSLTEAYQILLHYCTQYCFPLIPGDNEQPEGDDWWFERFGHDSHWGKERAPKEDTGK